jgi:hypothetical protein
MALDATEVRVGLTGNLYSAPLATAMPTTVATALPIAWVDLGYVSEDGLALTPNATVQDVKAWQTQYAVRRMTTDREFVSKFKLEQRNSDTLQLAFGGGSVVVASGVSTYTPPAGFETFERSFVLEVRDGTIIDRWLLYRGFPSISGDIVFKRDEATMFELEIGALADAAENVWKLVSNDPALVATA